MKTRLEDNNEKDDPEEDQEEPAISTQVGETIFNTQLAPKHHTKLPTQKKQNVKKIKKQAGAELCQAQVKLG